jgi:uncharacterized membrane protein YedE/YeeE
MAELAASPPLTAPTAAQRAGVRVPPWASLGILFGLLSTAAIALYGPIGVSGTYPRFVGAILRRVSPAYAASNPYLVKMGGLVTTETMLVVGLLVGGFLAALLGGTRAPSAEMVHAGETTAGRRYRDAFIGGLLIIFGARLAGGCTSGHIISGITQLAVSGVLFGAAVFGAGMLTARLMNGGR